MKNPKNSWYNWQQFSSKKFKIRQRLALDILHDFLITFDAFHYMNSLLNVTDNSAFWSVELNYIGADKLFTLGMIASPKHQEVLLDLIYKKAAKGIGNKDFKRRAAKIEAAIRSKVLKLAKTSASV